ncbi:DMT family transporter [Cereibacter azotoformans]|uniref:DMT family transporter n=1 Tax=Cereibacter azotoformans TaxID=43057 RepID=UPI00195DAC5B|nr:DMT family transporter [Cereibacter azotoformans]
MADRGTGKATVIGLIAIGLWAGLALFTVAAGEIPPFELLALSFGVAFISGLVVLVIRGRQAIARLRQPGAAWFSAFLAIFFYHALYFFALSAVPPARASLIAYLWPLLIVLFSALVPGGVRLNSRHLTGQLSVSLVPPSYSWTVRGSPRRWATSSAILQLSDAR